MKKRLISFVTLLLTISLLALCAGCSKPEETANTSVPGAPVAAVAAPPADETAPPTAETAPETGRNTALDAAFAAGEPLRLEPVILPSGDLGEGWTPIGLSPDGQTVVWRNYDSETKSTSLSLVRNGETIPVAFNADLGIGDPYGKAGRFTDTFFRDLPGYEGFSWSGDSRYIALSNVYVATKRMEGPDVSVIDTATGDLYLANSQQDGHEALKDGSDTGIVYLSRIDRGGNYLYFLLYDRQDKAYRFCRCPVKGGKPEILHSMQIDDNQAYDLAGFATMLEAADGSWLLTGINGRSSMPEDRRLSLIRFSPSGESWTMMVDPFVVPYPDWRFSSFCLSDSSGYGIDLLDSPASSQSSSLARSTVDSLATTFAYPPLQTHVNLMRILPGEDLPYDVWEIRKKADGESGRDAEMVRAESFLWSVKLQKNNYTAEELAGAAQWIPEDKDHFLPDGYDPTADLKDRDRMFIVSACMSPDGYYALVNAGSDSDYSLYLVSLETMEVRPVDVPDSLDTANLRNPMCYDIYKLLITWNEDGTLLVANYSSKRAEAFRLEFGK